MIIGMIFLFLVCQVISLGITAGVIYLVCWLLGIDFSWKIALAIWLILSLIKSCFNVTVEK